LHYFVESGGPQEYEVSQCLDVIQSVTCRTKS
jgi:hypothetical protein